MTKIKVTIKNLRFEKPTHEWQVRVDRSSVLGNPFYMRDESQRDIVCDKYRQYFNEQIANSNEKCDAFARKFVNELDRLADIAEKYGKLELFCWCAPKRCHAETIKTYLEYFFYEMEDN